jgi:ABC-type sugar transport system ATPase subunit
MGSETWVTAERAGTRLVARCPPDVDLAPGAAVTLTFDPARLHRFDRATGRRLD